MLYHMIAFAAGYLLDLIIGDPYKLPHPVRFMGMLISKLDHFFMDSVMNNHENDRSAANSTDTRSQVLKGVILCLLVIGLTGVSSVALLWAAYRIWLPAGILLESIMTCSCLAAKSLQQESMKVETALKIGSLEQARYAVSMIVGRDTAELDEAGVARAAVETVAENTSDGVIAPMLYTCIGGPVLGLMYKAVNTMDSMVGYHNDRYEYFGRPAARLDDFVNFIPARLSALLMVLAAYISGKEYSGSKAWQVFCRDRFNHKSPNSAQTESACAGALGLRLAGNASYFGKIVEKPYIGDELRQIQPADIGRTCRLMFVTELLCFLVCLAALAVGLVVLR